MASINLTICPVCGEEAFYPYITCTDHFVSGEAFTVHECRGCGFKYTANASDEDSIGKYYQSEAYISHSNTNRGAINYLYHLVRSYMLKRKRNLIEKAIHSQSGSILDVGTGTGYFLNEMNTHGWQTHGTEKSPQAKEFAKKEFNLSIDSPDAIFNYPNHHFDVITLWHVLEHIHLLQKNMEAFVRLLKPAGKLIIALPNHTSWDASHYKEYWAAWDVPRHLWHFGPAQIKMLGERYGFRLNQRLPMPFDAFYVSILSEKYKKSTFAIPKGILYGKISWLNSLFRPSQCSSVIYVFER
jgi:2-polyprenyl-3-methyl-5-hydroxy-6-metoxy-1,4-benzoquinol methylase